MYKAYGISTYLDALHDPQRDLWRHWYGAQHALLLDLHDPSKEDGDAGAL